MSDLQSTFQRVRAASKDIILLSSQQINDALTAVADKLSASHDAILTENQKDLDRMPEDNPKYDRLELTPKRLDGIAGDLRSVAGLPYPIGEVLEESILESGLRMEKIRVPLGVVGIIYEARPNVTFDVFALCLKSGNACLLKGGSDAEFSNKIIVRLIKETLQDLSINPEIIELLPPDRSATQEMLNAVGHVDIIIPRGSQNLINFVRDNAKVPVIETGAGIVHTYFDASGALDKGRAIVTNAKTRRVSVCNALDCLIVHESRKSEIPELVKDLAAYNVEVFADPMAHAMLEGHYPADLLKRADKAHFGTEFLDYKMSIVTVASLPEALQHIDHYSSQHSEAIVAEDPEVVDQFLKQVDAAAVYANASTAFTDGAQFGLGAEIGISTQKLHARGPMALREMTSYKWLVRGDGTVRS